MKGIILHGGHGTRLRPLTHTGPKQLLPIANKPMSQYALEDLIDSGITDIAIIIGDIYPNMVKEFYGDGKKFGINIKYIFQKEPKGIAHAIRLCKDFVENEKFVVYLGDNLLKDGIKKHVNRFSKSNVDAMILLSKVDNPPKFGVAVIENNMIIKIIEKPKKFLSDLAVTGIYFLNSKIFDMIDMLKPSWRNELEITEALQMLIEKNLTLEFHKVTEWWKDTGTPEDILHANQLILDSIEDSSQNKSSTYGKNQNKIMIGNNSSISDNCKVIGPVILGDNCTVDNHVTIGPNVSLGNNCVLNRCNIENSIIMSNCKIDSNIKILDSIIAKDSEITGNFQNRVFRFLLGERSKLESN